MIIKKHIKTLKESLTVVKKQPVYLVVPILIEIIFLFLLGFFGSLILNRAIPYMQKVAEIKGEVTATSLEEYGSSFVTQQLELSPLISQILIIFFQLALFILVVWIIFKGINWFLAAKSLGKVDFKKYSLNFVFIMVINAIFIFIITLFYYFATLKTALRLGAPIFQPVINTITIVASLILLYFMLISFSICHKYKLKEICKKTIKIGIEDFKNIITAYIILAVLFVIANYIVRILSFRFEVMLVAGVIFILPLIVISRIFLIKVIN